MTTGTVTEETSTDGGERRRDHVKMAAALSHILTSSEEKVRAHSHVITILTCVSHTYTVPNPFTLQLKPSDVIRGRRKRRRERKNEDGVEAECSRSSDEDGDVHSTAGDVVTGCRQLPDVASLDHERRLQRIATAGGGENPGHY